jgi:M6 family metalloprotease-like protein
MNKTVGAYARDSPMSVDDADNDGYPDTWRLIQEAIYAADPDVDFGQYSYLAILHSGLGEETSGNSNDIWSCAYLGGIWLRTRDGVTYSKAMIVPELESQGADTVGVIAHEFGHLLGLPDLYDPYRRNDYTGRWELMSKGLWNGNPASSSPAHLLAWAKIRLGWISESQIATVPGGVIRTITINPLELNGTILAVKIPITDKTYYLLELRQRIGYDIGLPDTGLLASQWE